MIEFIFPLFFLVFLGVFVYTFVTGIGQWHKNNQSPRPHVQATVVAKRTNVSRGRSAGSDHMHIRGTTTYYATFQVASGDRMELQLDGYDYGMLVEGDKGELYFQGTRFLGFTRQFDQSEG